MTGTRKILTTLSMLVLLLMLSAAAVYAGTSGKGTITGDSVNVRTKPDTSSKVVIQLAKGTDVSVTSTEGDWCKISCNDASGWVSRQYISIGEAVIAKGTVKGNDVNVRSKADTSSEVITKLDKGAKVDITRKTSGWYRIVIGDDRYGWVSSDLITCREENTSRGLTDEISSPVNVDKQSDSSKENGDKVSGDADLRQQIVAYAKKFLGVKYVYGGSSPKGFDCSGFVQYVFKHFDIKLDRSSDSQALNGTKIRKGELKPGDTVFFDTNGGHNAVEHAGIYVGNGQFVHASSGRSNHKVVISNINEGFYDESYMWARRVIND